eukprot:jgi/Mesvir1/18898/Mv18895-RA.1
MVTSNELCVAPPKFLLLLEGKPADDCPLTRAEEEETRRSFKSADEYLVSLRKQAAVAKMSKRGSSQYKGVTWDKASKKWRAQAKIDGKKRHLGCFIIEEDAMRAVDAAILARDGAAAITNLSFLRDGVADEAIIIKTMQRQSAAVAPLAGDSDDADVDTPAMEESDDDADGCPPLLQLSASSDDDDARGDHGSSRGGSDSEPDSDSDNSDEEQAWPQAAIDEFEKMYGTRDYQAATARMRQQLWGVPRNDICLIRQVDPK